MSIKSTHPLYDSFINKFIKMKDFYNGRDAILKNIQSYLPPTEAMILDGMGLGEPGKRIYDAYVTRADFPEYVSDAVKFASSKLHKKDAVFNLPRELEPLLEDCNGKGLSLQYFLRLINMEQLVTGRLGLMMDFPIKQTGFPLPILSIYAANTLRNWGEKEDGSKFIILDESGYKLKNNDFSWQYIEKYRVLWVKDNVYFQEIYEGERLKNKIRPLALSRTIPEIPFEFINTKDLLPDPDTPPFENLANLACLILRGDADYRQHLFSQGQDTLVISSNRMLNKLEADNGNIRTGSGAAIVLENEGRAGYEGIKSEGLAEQRLALENARNRAESIIGGSLSQKGGNIESAEALSIRLGAKVVTLSDIAKTGAAGLQSILRKSASLLGLNPDQVIVEPNLDFNDIIINWSDLKSLQEGANIGMPFSKKSMHGVLSEHGVTNLTFEEELQQIEKEIGDGL